MMTKKNRKLFEKWQRQSNQKNKYVQFLEKKRSRHEKNLLDTSN